MPLDRTAAGGTRSTLQTSYWLVDPLQPGSRRKLADLPGAGWYGGAVSHDDRTLALTRYVSAAESEVWLLDIASGARRRVLPADGAAPASHSYSTSAATAMRCSSPATAQANSAN